MQRCKSIRGYFLSLPTKEKSSSGEIIFILYRVFVVPPWSVNNEALQGCRFWYWLNKKLGETTPLPPWFWSVGEGSSLTMLFGGWDLGRLHLTDSPQELLSLETLPLETNGAWDHIARTHTDKWPTVNSNNYFHFSYSLVVNLAGFDFKCQLFTKLSAILCERFTNICNLHLLFLDSGGKAGFQYTQSLTCLSAN